MQVRGHHVGVCSWSLLPSTDADLLSKIQSLELTHVQLGLGSVFSKDAVFETAKALRDAGITITATAISFPKEDYSSIALIQRSGGLVPDELWLSRRDLVLAAAEVTSALGVKYLSFHFGFVPSSSDPHYNTLVERVRELLLAMAGNNVTLLAETGQESASELLQFLNDLNCNNVGVNFDPANFLLYGSGDPFDAIEFLGRHIKHVHVKDAMPSSQPRMKWGEEVVLGNGEIDPLLLIDALEESGYDGPLMIERETGLNRLLDIGIAAEFLESIGDLEELEADDAVE